MHIHIFMCTHARTHTHTHTYVCMCTHTHVHTHVHTHTHTHLCAHTRTHARTHAHTHLWTERLRSCTGSSAGRRPPSCGRSSVPLPANGSSTGTACARTGTGKAGAQARRGEEKKRDTTPPNRMDTKSPDGGSLRAEGRYGRRVATGGRRT